MLTLVTCYLLFINITPLPAKNIFTKDTPTRLWILKRRIIQSSDESIIDVSKSIDNLPPVKPEHTILHPILNILKRSIGHIHKPKGALVYGNFENVGLTYGKTNQRVLYTSFRKSEIDDSVKKILIEAVKNIQDTIPDQRNQQVIVLEIDPDSLQSPTPDYYAEDTEMENNATEVLDDSSDTAMDLHGTRRLQKLKSKYRERDAKFKSSSSESASSQASDYERNPGNPYTVYKDKYKQNWPWHHSMDGDHMNVNPYAPQFSNVGPSGASLFFGRKWWYFNQDDYKPLH